MVSAATMEEDKYSVFSMPAEEFIEPGICGSNYDIASLSQRLVSQIKITDTPYQQAGANTKDVPTAKTLHLKIATQWYLQKL